MVVDVYDNDTHGHMSGDEVLKRVARTLRDACRLTDLVGRMPGVVGRAGGDEFVVLMPETDGVGAREPARRFIEAIQKLAIDLENGGRIDSLGLSIGVAVYPNDGRERKALIQEADAAMYRAKQAGGNRFADSSREVSVP